MESVNQEPIPISIITKDSQFGEFLGREFTKTNAFSAKYFSSGLRGMKELLKNGKKYAAVIIDFHLKQITGKVIVERLRGIGLNVPIVVLIEGKSAAVVIDCLKAGADICLHKPIDPEVIIAQLEAMLGRVGAVSPQNSIVIGALSMDLAKVEVRLNGKQIPLTEKEFKLLAFLLRNRGVVVSRQQILENVWGHDNRSQSRIIDVHVSHLRKKLEGSSSDSKSIIRTIKGFGYIVD